MWKVFLIYTTPNDSHQNWYETQIYRKRANVKQPSWYELWHFLFFFLINKSHYILMPPLAPTPPFVSMSLDVSAKSQRVAPQARRRYLVIHIEIYGPKWGEGGHIDSLSACQYTPAIVHPSLRCKPVSDTLLFLMYTIISLLMGLLSR